MSWLSHTYVTPQGRRGLALAIMLLITLIGAGALPSRPTRATATPATATTIYLPWVLDERPPLAPLPIAQLGTAVPVAQKGNAFFADQINDSTGSLALWIPPNAYPIRGIFFENSAFNLRPNPADPDWRNQVAQSRVQASRQLASLWGFAYLTGSVWLDSCRNFACQEALLHGALEEFARVTGRSELRVAPLLISGASRTAGFGGAYARAYPARTIAYTINVMDSAGYAPGVPGIIVYGEQDGQASRISSFLRDRAQGALLGIAPVWGKGHICDRCGDLIWPWMDAVVRLRLPEDADPRQGPVSLRPIAERDGWLGDIDSWGRAYAYADYPGDRLRAAWLPDRTTALIWQSFVRRAPPATLTWPTQPYAWSNGFTQQPAPLYGRDARDLSASRPIDLIASVAAAPGGEVRVFAGGQDLGAATLSSDGRRLELKGVRLGSGLHSLLLMRGGEPISWPAGLLLLP